MAERVKMVKPVVKVDKVVVEDLLAEKVANGVLVDQVEKLVMQ